MGNKKTTFIFATVGMVVAVLAVGFGMFYITTRNNKPAAVNTNTAANQGTSGLQVSDDSDNLDDVDQRTGAGGDGTDRTGTTQSTSSTQFGDGLYLVNENIAPGKYLSDGPDDCKWERLSKLSGYKNVIATGKVHGPTTVEILATDKAFRSTDCGTWIHQK